MALFVGLGRGKEAAIIAISRQIVFFIPLLYILSELFGSIGVWIALPLADLLSLILGIFIIRKIFKEKEFNKN